MLEQSLGAPAAPRSTSEASPRLSDRLVHHVPPARQPARQAAGQALLASVDEILRKFGERLQVQNVGSGVRSLAAPQLADHTAAFPADLAVNLRGLDCTQDQAAPTTIFSGIQRHCATEHGRQRGRLGWAASDLEVEYAVLEEELTGRVRALESDRQGEQEPVVDLIRACLVQAQAFSIGALREVRSRL